jgi:predicted RNA-binding Zn-ribbon protein involved in translation (DUF1610 family)
MQELLSKLSEDYPFVQFKPGSVLTWSSKNKTILYPADMDAQKNLPGVLHEIGHAILDHQEYQSDMDLLLKERSAWQIAIKLAENYGCSITSDYVEDCIDTYREWLYKRSICPKCTTCGFQLNRLLYSCPNCNFEWKVTSSRNCRQYRLKKAYK